MKLSLTVCLSLGALVVGWAQSPVGTWKGDLTLPNIKLPLVFHVAEDNPGQYTTTLDSPKQNAYGLKANATVWTKPHLAIKMDILGLSYGGEVQKDSLIGIITQGGISHKFDLVRAVDATEKVKRPQTPKAPFPYLSKEVTIQSTAEVTLAGTLTYPEKNCKGAVVLISGSGPQDRNSTVFEHQPFYVLADYLSRNGYAVLRYDDRGFGQSTGNFAEATTFDFAVDADAALAYLRQQPEFKKVKIGVIGHSEGGLIAPMLKNQPNFIISLAGSGIPGDQILLQQQEWAMRNQNNPDAIIRKVLGVSQDFFATVKAHTNYIMAVQEFNEQYANDQDQVVRYQANGLAESLNPWLFEFIRIRPADYWQHVKCPVLLINGDKDTQVVADANLTAIENALKKGKNPAVKTLRLLDINHLMQKATTGDVSEYREIEETVNLAVLEAIKQFLNQQN